MDLYPALLILHFLFTLTLFCFVLGIQIAVFIPLNNGNESFNLDHLF